MKTSGIIKITNLKTDKIYLLASSDIENDIISIRFDLDLSRFKCKELQDDYENIGLELFTIEKEREAQGDELDSFLSDVKEEYKSKNYSFYH